MTAGLMSDTESQARTAPPVPRRFTLLAWGLPGFVFGVLLLAWPFNLPNAAAVYDESLAPYISPLRQSWGYFTIAYYPHLYFASTIVALVLRWLGLGVLPVLTIACLPLLTAHAQFCLWMLTGVELIAIAPK